MQVSSIPGGVPGAARFGVAEEAVVERVAADRGAVPHYDQLLAGPGERHVHAADVGEKAELAGIVAARERDDHGFLLASLEAVHRVHLELGMRGEELAEQLYLRVVGRDHRYVLRRDPAFQEP